jgi:hypothetical protein
MTKAAIAEPWATIDGKTISQWSVDWLKSVMDAPASNPLVDPFGEKPTDGSLQNGQTGPVAFLYGGNWSGGTIPNVTIHSGQDVLVPLVNAIDVENGTIGGSTIGDWVQKTGLGYGAEAKLLSAAGSLHVDDAHLTVAKTSDPSNPVLSLKWPLSEAFSADSGVFSLGTLSDSTYAGHAFLQTNTGATVNIPYADVAGRWAMITDLPKGDYTVNYGGSISAVRNPFKPSQVIYGTPDGGDFKTDTTVLLHVT